MLLQTDWFFQDVDWLHFLSVPVFTGVVGWLIIWTGLQFASSWNLGVNPFAPELAALYNNNKLAFIDGRFGDLRCAGRKIPAR